MSSTLWVTCARPASAAALISTIDQPALRLVAGEVAGWPEPTALLWLPGESARGVELSHDGTRLAVRILATSSPGDYAVAFRIAERLGGEGVVEVEGHGPVAAAGIGEALAEWMVRDRATSVAALRAALAAGHTVVINGPVAALEIAADATADVADAWRVLRDAQVRPEAAAGGAPEDDAAAEAETPWRLAIVIVGGVATGFAVPEDADLDAMLAGGPAAAEAAARRFPVATGVDYLIARGWLLDRDREVLLVAYPVRVPDPEGWPTYTVEEVPDGFGLAAHLGEHGHALPFVTTAEPDAAVVAIHRDVTRGAAEHGAWLRRRDRALPADTRSASFWLMLPLLMALLAPALVVRLLTIPLRGALRRRSERRRERLLADGRARLLSWTAALAAAPDDLVKRHDRAVALCGVGWFAAGDRALTAILADLDAGGSGVARHKVLHNLSVARQGLGLGRLAAATAREAREAGHPRPNRLVSFGQALVVLLRAIAGV